MNASSTQPASRPGKKTASHVINFTGIVLLVAAAILYWRDMRVHREQAAAAELVRLNATTPMMAMCLMLDSTASNILVGCSHDIATNIIMHLARAEPTDFPSGIVEGDEYKIYLMFTNRTTAVMRAVRLYDAPFSPSNLYVGMEYPVKFDENKIPIAFSYTRPALVPELGGLFKALADKHVPTLQRDSAKHQAALAEYAARLAEASAAARLDESTNAAAATWFDDGASEAAPLPPETSSDAPEAHPSSPETP
ncbi:MAG: hypothetical protein ACOX9C_01225 [Kiritimatiellia bacterium]|jgi:hypothetical protein